MGSSAQNMEEIPKGELKACTSSGSYWFSHTVLSLKRWFLHNPPHTASTISCDLAGSVTNDKFLVIFSGCPVKFHLQLINALYGYFLSFLVQDTEGDIEMLSAKFLTAFATLMVGSCRVEYF